MTTQRQLYDQAGGDSSQVSTITIGTVIDTNDPQQMGRVRVVCPQWGDSWQANVESIPWAIYMSPFGGHTQVGARGPGVQESEGSIAYGAWWIPTTGAQVVVMCVDGNPMTRMYIGSIFEQFTPHTLPHGRFMYDDHPELEKSGDDPKPYGPYTSSEKFIQPLADNMKQAFGHQGDPNHEYRTRAADYTAARVDVSQLSQTYSKVQDDKDIEADDWISTQGYQQSRLDPNGPTTLTDKNMDSMVYSLTSPGFHSISMDDRQENCRIRIRTTSGAQFLIDDTNERIYMSTAKGNNWVEMDQDGNIDVFATNKLNIHAVKDINFTSDETIRLYAKKGVHIRSEDETRIESLKDIHVKTPQSFRVHTEASIYLQADVNFDVKSGSVLHLTSGSTMNFNAGGNILQTGTAIHLNGPTAEQASSANEQLAFWTSRVPAHEPWARVMTKNDFTHDPELEYTDKQVNKIERGRQIDRGMFWRR